jgi:hypothetical protein
MKGNLLTRNEHTARAMLLGLVYDPRDGTYCREEFDGDGHLASTQGEMLDCETLVVIKAGVQSKRMNAFWKSYMGEDGGNHVNPDIPNMPWEAPDE